MWAGLVRGGDVLLHHTLTSPTQQTAFSKEETMQVL